MVNRLRSSPLLRVGLALVALGFLAYGLSRNWNDTVAAMARLSWWTVAGSFAAVLVGLGFMLVAWQVVLAGFGSPLPMRVAAKVLFVGQLGKYVPGSVWAFAAMMELARDHGSPPRRTFGATVIGLVVSLGCALGLAAVTLPLTSQDVARQTWYLLLLIPFIVAGLHPRVLTFALNLVLRVARREPLEQVLPGRAMLVAAAWTMGGWLFYGLHIWLLLRDMAPGGPSLLAVAAGAYALAWVTGLLTVIIPAGIGVREGAMVLVLAPVLDAPHALVIAVVSRLAFTFADVAWAGIGFVAARGQAPADSKAAVYAAQ
ncbi:lysylphosphatidylglycerol synthase transmembrane domain-containing protein [Sphaerisporangium sp. NPDC005288]|uniref:lysylphosphatidylglycerol synthase transmembrane domain-containing protein n=1 Tax=Sphaerisporangium sp. NPDC005288 TaxID=3155114 RepID=UPI0033AACF1B